jgi:hypothetical protein
MKYYRMKANLPTAKPGMPPKYPFLDLAVGENFVVKAKAKDARVMQQKLSTLGCGFARRTGRKFATRRVPEGVGVWRVK